MAAQFDPYYKWLGIAPKDQPPHFYRLLGIDLYEPDSDVIDAAANRIMLYLHELASGDQSVSDDSQRLLNEIAKARLCLLDSDAKQNYDARLRNHLEGAKADNGQRERLVILPPHEKMVITPDQLEDERLGPEPPPFPEFSSAASDIFAANLKELYATELRPSDVSPPQSPSKPQAAPPDETTDPETGHIALMIAIGFGVMLILIVIARLVWLAVQ